MIARAMHDENDFARLRTAGSQGLRDLLHNYLIVKTTTQYCTKFVN